MVTLEQNTVVYPPNKAFERRIDFSKTPQIYRHLLFIDINEKGEALVGSSSLDKTLWESSSLIFKNSESLLELDYKNAYIGSTASDGKFLTENTLVLAEDTGLLNILSIGDKQIVCHNYFREVDRIPKLSLWKNSPRILTCAGNNVTVWDVNSNSKQPFSRYKNFHTAPVNYVDAVKREPNLFASASMDRKCVLWDDRNSNPAQVLYQNEFSALTSVACNQNNLNYIVVGTEAGDIYLLDKRDPGEFISVANCGCNVYRLVFDDSNRLAVCGDFNKVLVFKCEDEILNNAYCNDKHDGIVRGLVWFDENLYSCGFDKQVVKHVL